MTKAELRDRLTKLAVSANEAVKEGADWSKLFVWWDSGPALVLAEAEEDGDIEEVLASLPDYPSVGVEHLTPARIHWLAGFTQTKIDV